MSREFLILNKCAWISRMTTFLRIAFDITDEELEKRILWI